jgi:hypothetical protein
MAEKFDTGGVKPFSPDEAADAKLTFLHPKLIEAINELLSKGYSHRGGTITFTQKALVDLAGRKINDSLGMLGEDMDAPGYNESTVKPTIPRFDFFLNAGMNFEEVYRKQGWKVVKDSPGWDETYSTFYEFSRN